MKIFIDSTGWLNMIDPDMPEHRTFQKEFKEFLDEGHSFYTTNVILGEAISEIKKRMGAQKADEVYSVVEESWLGTHLHILWIGRRTFRDAVRLFRRFPNENLSVFEAANVILMNRRNIRFIMTTQTVYSKMGFKLVPDTEAETE
ncbi:MAG: hypothetical protein Kow0037_00300 [Calditrichia bacterium]